MSDLTPEEQALLDAEASTAAPRRGRPPRRAAEDAPAAEPEHGPHTPPQFGDDGWAGLPIQMRN